MHAIVRDLTVAALPDDDFWGERVDFANMVNMVIEDAILSVDVVRSRSIVAQQNASSADAFNNVARSRVLPKLWISDISRSFFSLTKLPLPSS